MGIRPIKNIKYSKIIIFACLVFISIFIFLLQKIAGPKNINVIFIVIDALRADHLSGYGYHRLTSPNIDKLSKDGVKFNRAFSQSNCTYLSMPSIFTSLYPSFNPEHFLAVIPYGETIILLNDEYTTIAEVFNDAGYLVSAESAQPWVSPETGFAQGFTSFNVLSSCDETFHDQKVIESVIRWLDANSNKKFFLFINLMGPHPPYDPPPPLDKLYLSKYNNDSELEKTLLACKDFDKYWETLCKGTRENISQRDLDYLISMYDGEIRFTDFQIGRLIKKLKRLKIYKNTLIVLTADHGQAFLEHNRLVHNVNLYNEEIHVPLIMVLPDKLPREREINDIVELVDIFPTLTDIVGIPLANIKIQGVSILPLIDNTSSSKMYVCAISKSHKKYMDNKWSFIYDLNKDFCELYDLENDPKELLNIAKGKPEIVFELKNKLSEISRQTPYKLRLQKENMSEELKEKLKSLGYLQ